MRKFSVSFSLFVALFAALAFSFAPQADGGYKVGDSVEDFTLKSVSGKKVSLGSMEEAKGFVVTFTCNHCPYAKMYEDRLIALHNEYAEKGYPVIAINPNTKTVGDDDFKHMKKRAKEKGFPFEYLADDSQEVAKAFGAAKTPHVYVVQRDGEAFKVRYIGAIDNDPKGGKPDKHYLRDALNALLQGEEVENANTLAVGCTIKWKK